MRNVLRIVALLSLLTAAVLAWPGASSATAPSGYGWWYRLNDRQLTGAPVPPPPQGVPERGMYVARDANPDEALAVGAMRFDAPAGQAARLELAVDPDYYEQALTAQIVACPTTGSFPTEFGALWENRPTPRCEDGKVMGEALADGSVMIWELTGAFEVFTGFWSFVLHPDCVPDDVSAGGASGAQYDVGCETSGPQARQPFQVAFEEPDAAVFTVTQPDPGAPPPPPSNVSGGGFGGGSGGTFTSPGGSGGGFSGGTGTGGTTSFTDPSTPVPDLGADMTPDTAGEERAAPTAGGGATSDSLARIVAIAMLAALGAGLWIASILTAGSRVAVAGAGGADEGGEGPSGPLGGLGRFVRERLSRPRSLR